MISSARYIDPANSLVEAVIDGVTTQELGGGTPNPVIRAWMAAGNEPEAYVPPPPAPPVVPEDISDRQFAQGLAVNGIITEPEALEWVGPGTIPAALVAFIGQLPADQQFGARMLLSGATVFKRHHPLTDTFAGANGWTSEQTDDFWRFCASL